MFGNHDGNKARHSFTDVEDFKSKLFPVLDVGPEQDIIDLLNDFVFQYGAKALLDISVPVTIDATISKELSNVEVSEKISAKISLLACACIKRNKNLAEKLITLGAPIDDGVIVPDDVHHLMFSPLTWASEHNDLEMANLLLQHGASLFYKDSNDKNAFMCAKSEEMANLIVEYAEKQGVMDKFVQEKNSDNLPIFVNACWQGVCDIASQLLSKMNLDTLKQNEREKMLYAMLHHTTVASWDHPEKAQKFIQLRQQIKEKMQQYKISFPQLIKEFDKDCSSLSEQEAYSKLFGDVFPETTLDNKDEAVRKAIAQIYSLLDSPQECIPYLQFLNNEFSRYYREKYQEEFGSLNADSYEFKNINGMYFPTPGAHYKGLEKKGALQEFLISLLREQGIAENAYKWVGYIPHEVADKMVANGDFVMESRLGAGLFHYKVAHMLQQAMIAYAMQDGRIHTAFVENGKPMQITHKDILQGLVTMRDQFGEALWIVVRDRLHMREVTFSDPNRMCSVMMRHGHELGIENLSNYMIDNCCKGLMHLLDAVNKMDSRQVDMMVAELVDYLSDINTAEFFMSDKLQKYALNYSLAHEKAKGKLTEEDEYKIVEGRKFVAVPKKYHPNLLFKPKPFSSVSQDKVQLMEERIEKRLQV